ncbi:hypothetical protein HanRHA438_Chr00c08g0847561 [Helianthus annuus]|nr:hypothetical protein HanRHA438_Chr00c08g0847561 [Helianthus annuus]
MLFKTFCRSKEYSKLTACIQPSFPFWVLANFWKYYARFFFSSIIHGSILVGFQTHGVPSTTINTARALPFDPSTHNSTPSRILATRFETTCTLSEASPETKMTTGDNEARRSLKLLPKQPSSPERLESSPRFGILPVNPFHFFLSFYE